MEARPTRSLRDPLPEALDAALAAAAEPYVDGPWVVSEETPDELVSGLMREVEAHVAAAAATAQGWDDTRVVDALAGAERAARAATARGLRWAAELAARRPAVSADPDDEGLSRYALDEIGVATGLARGAARARLAEALLATDQFPRLLDALEAGLIAPAGLRKVLELTTGLSSASCRALQARLLVRLGRPHVADLDRVDLAGMLMLDPEVVRSVATRATTAWLGRQVRSLYSDQVERERLAAARAAERAKRRVTVDPGRDGMSYLVLHAPEALTAAAYERVDRLAQQLGGPGDDRSMDQKRADALLDLVLGRADHAPGAAQQWRATETEVEGDASAGGWGAAPVNLDVIVDHTRCAPESDCVGEAGRLGPVNRDSLAALLDLVEETGGTVSGGHARPTACPGDQVHHEEGPGPYEPGEPLRRFLRAQWRRCAFPGCGRSARRCELDHTKRHRDGGPTCRCNLAPLCIHHHHLKHDQPQAWPAWRLTNHGDRLTWVSPTGLVVHVSPDPPDPPPAPAVDPPPY